MTGAPGFGWPASPIQGVKQLHDAITTAFIPEGEVGRLRKPPRQLGRSGRGGEGYKLVRKNVTVDWYTIHNTQNGVMCELRYIRLHD